MIILGGSASGRLAEKVSKEFGFEPGRLEIKKFPDGEKYVRVHEDVKGQDVAVIQSLYGPDRNENIFEYLLLVDTLRDLGARSITGVAPYLAYARQDARFYPGEAVSSSSVARLFEAAGTTSFLTVDCQLHRLGGVAKVFKIPAQNLSAMPLLGRYARENLTPRNPIVIAPDAGAEDWAAAAAVKALWRRDWSIKPAGQVWLDHVFKEWWTDVAGVTGRDGHFATRGFLGDYEITVRSGNRRTTVKASLAHSGASVRVVL